MGRTGTGTGTNTRTTGTSRRSNYSTKEARANKAEHDRKASIVPALAARSYHLPGNSYCRDLYQYFANNHPVLSICLHHKDHPLGFLERLVALVGSIAFGLALTNVFFLSFILGDDKYKEPLFSVAFNRKNSSRFAEFSSGNNGTATDTDIGMDFGTDNGVFIVTYGMIILWTVGGAAHSLFDMSLWYISACSCCHPGGCLESMGYFRRLGSGVVLLVVVIIVAISTFIVVLRVSVESSDELLTLQNITSGGITDDNVDLGTIDGLKSFEFLLTFLIELALAFLVYFPLLSFILFTGVLGCGKLPLLGGRPREVMLEERNKNKLQRSSTKDTEEDLV